MTNRGDQPLTAIPGLSLYRRDNPTQPARIIRREILYRLLIGDQGTRLRQMAAAGSQSQQIAQAINWLKGNFTQPLRIDDRAGRKKLDRDISDKAALK